MKAKRDSKERASQEVLCRRVCYGIDMDWGTNEQ